MQSKALDRSVRTAPTMKLLYKFYHSILPPFLSAHVEYCMTFYMLLKRCKKLFCIRNHKVFSKSFVNLWEGVQNTHWSKISNTVFVFCLFIQRFSTSYLCITRENVIFETNVYCYRKWCTQRNFILTNSFSWVQFLKTLPNFVNIYQQYFLLLQ